MPDTATAAQCRQNRTYQPCLKGHKPWLKRRIADMAFNADVGMATCKRCGDAVPYIILPNLQTGEPVMGVADNKWKRANCPVDVGKPCPFLIAEGVADSTDDTIEVDQ